MKSRLTALLAGCVLVVGPIVLTGAPARADAAHGYTDTDGQIDPLLAKPLPVVNFAADGAGNVVEQVSGAAGRSDGEVYVFPAGTTTSKDLGPSAGTGVSIASGWVAFETGTPDKPTGVSVGQLPGGSPRTVTLSSGQSLVGVDGMGDLILDVTGATTHSLDLLSAGGTLTSLISGASAVDATADGTEIVAAADQAGSWLLDHVDISGAKPLVTKVGAAQSDEPDLFTTAQTYGWDDPQAGTMSWEHRGSTGPPAVVTLPSDFQYSAMTDGSTVTWVGSYGLEEAPLGNLAAVGVLPTYDDQSAAYSPRGLLFLGGEPLDDFGLEVLASDNTYSDLDQIGASLENVGALALTGGRLVRFGTEVTSTPLTTGDVPEQAADSTDILNQSDPYVHGGRVWASGPYTAVPLGAPSQSFEVLNGSQVVFTSPAGVNAQIEDLHGTDLVYSLPNTEQGLRIRDLATGSEARAPNSQAVGGGVVYDFANVLGGKLNLTFQNEAVGASLQTVSVPVPASCPAPSQFPSRGSGHWVQLVCGSTNVVIDTLTGKSYPAPDGAGVLGDGILVETPQTNGSSCVSVQVLTSGETAPTCVGENSGTAAVVDDSGGTVAWVDGDQVTHIIKVLPDAPSVGAPTFPAVVTVGSTWNLSLPVSAATTWTLTLTLPNSSTNVVTGSSPAGTLQANWLANDPSLLNSYGAMRWSLVATAAGGREFATSGAFTVASPKADPTASNYTIPYNRAPVYPSPHLTYSLGKVKKVAGVDIYKRGQLVSLTVSPVGRLGCVKVALQFFTDLRYRTISTSHCLSATKHTVVKEQLHKKGMYRLALVWSLKKSPLKLIAIRAV